MHPPRITSNTPIAQFNIINYTKIRLIKLLDYIRKR